MPTLAEKTPLYDVMVETLDGKKFCADTKLVWNDALKLADKIKPYSSQYSGGIVWYSNRGYINRDHVVRVHIYDSMHWVLGNHVQRYLEDEDE